MYLQAHSKLDEVNNNKFQTSKKEKTREKTRQGNGEKKKEKKNKKQSTTLRHIPHNVRLGRVRLHMQPLSYPPQVILPLRAQQQQPRLPQRQGAAEMLAAGRAV